MGETLLNAAEKGHLKTVQALLKKGHKIDSTDSQGTTPLMLACLYGHKNLVEELLRRGADVKRLGDFGGALSHAVGVDGKLEIVKRLLAAGADVNERSLIENNETPIFCACRVGRPDLAKILLEVGADVNIENDWGDTPLWEVCANNEAALPAKMQKAYPQVVRLLIEYGADVSLRDEYSSILITACDTDANNVAEMVEMILKAGPRQMLAYKNSDGLTALDVAKQHNNRQLVQLLVRAEKSMPERNADGSKN